MTDQQTHSLTFSAKQARGAFPGTSPAGSLVPALLAGIPPEAHWEGCLVFSAPEAGDSLVLGVRGPGADVVCTRLAAALTRVGVEVLRAGQDPELTVEAPIARVDGGIWRQ